MNLLERSREMLKLIDEKIINQKIDGCVEHLG